MTSLQKTIKYIAMAFAAFLTVSIFFGIFAVLGVFNLVEKVGDKKADIQLGELKTYTVNDNVTDIEIDVAVAEFTVIPADSFYVESNIESITVKVNSDCLKIDDNSDGFNTSVLTEAAVLNVYVPAGYSFGNVDIDTGAGGVCINSVTTNELELDLGAGEVEIKNVTSLDKTEISGGTGDVTVTDCKFYYADLSMGVGSFSFSGELLGNSSVDMGIGQADITLHGGKDSYCISISKGIGAAAVDGHSVKDNDIFGNGKNKIDISGGIGELNVAF